MPNTLIYSISIDEAVHYHEDDEIIERYDFRINQFWGKGVINYTHCNYQ